MTDENKFSQKEFAKVINVSVRTLQRWDKSGLLRADRTISHKPVYTKKHLDKINKGDVNG